MKDDKRQDDNGQGNRHGHGRPIDQTNDPSQNHREQDATDLVIERSLDGELAHQDRVRFDERLLADPQFRRDYAQVAQIATHLHELPHPGEDPAFVDEVMARIVSSQGQTEPHRAADSTSDRTWTKIAGALALGLIAGGLTGFVLARRTTSKTGTPQPPKQQVARAETHGAASSRASQHPSLHGTNPNRCVTLRATKVRFAIRAPGAHYVSLAGDFTKWSPRKLQDPDSDGVWTITVNLRPGTYQYNFLVDGSRWVTDPTADGLRPDGFGGYNSVIRL